MTTIQIMIIEPAFVHIMNPLSTIRKLSNFLFVTVYCKKVLINHNSFIAYHVVRICAGIRRIKSCYSFHFVFSDSSVKFIRQFERYSRRGVCGAVEVKTVSKAKEQGSKPTQLILSFNYTSIQLCLSFLRHSTSFSFKV